MTRVQFTLVLDDVENVSRKWEGDPRDAIAESLMQAVDKLDESMELPIRGVILDREGERVGKWRASALPDEPSHRTSVPGRMNLTVLERKF